ncbi:MAG: hypothetical protein MJ120_00205 [Clostridia bacterium]|nr:hypothetical protein [Clostridia bacterium]
MANETYKLDYSDISDLMRELTSRGAKVEPVLNTYIHSTAPNIIKPSMTALVPVSDRNKKHAKSSNPFGRQEDFNLKVKIITSKPFNYLVFPDEGLGTSYNHAPQNFTGRGLEKVLDRMAEEMTEQLQKLF